jgi:hypothetical protein
MRTTEIIWGFPLVAAVIEQLCWWPVRRHLRPDAPRDLFRRMMPSSRMLTPEGQRLRRRAVKQSLTLLLGWFVLVAALLVFRGRGGT